MSKGYIKKVAGSLLCASVSFSAVGPVWADNDAKEGSKPAPTLNLARLAAVLQAASDRKQAGDEVTLKKDVYLRGRPVADVSAGGLLRAGTVVRRSKRQIVNAGGSWRHIETREGLDGWIHDFELDPD